jgi:2-keto-4-pentenoate hydratase
VPGKVLDMPVFTEGFAAVEGEVTAVLGADAPAGKTDYTLADALDLIAAMHVGVEIASSPFAEINDHGPLVTISDFGNNNGLILGEKIADWRRFQLRDWQFEIRINGESVGLNVPGGMPGGPLESVRFLLENVARRGRPAKAGMMILTGAVTGVHRARAGDRAEVVFNGGAAIACRLVPARPVG